jgi:excisionase family DNA binding protein
MNNTNEKPLFTKEEFAVSHNISVATVNRLIKKNGLPTIRIGKRVLISISATIPEKKARIKKEATL